jgi:hypothetical protein
MSFGFIRKQSPASIADARRRAAGKRLHELRDLKINEVSSVDRGAGENCRVVLIKGDPIQKWDGRGQLGYRGYRYVKEESDMSNTLQDRVAKSHQAAMEGHISFAKAASEQMDRAREMFPTAANPMVEYLKTDIGKRDINGLHKSEFIRKQWETRLGDGVHAIMKLGDDAPKEHATIDPDGTEEPWDKRVQAVMDKLGCTKDQAITHLHRAEKVLKGM